MSGLALMVASVVNQPRSIVGGQFLLVFMAVVLTFFIPRENLGYSRTAGVPPYDMGNRLSLNHPYANDEIGWRMTVFSTPVVHFNKLFQNIYDVTGTTGGWSARSALSEHIAMRTPRSFTWEDFASPVGWNETVGFPACTTTYTGSDCSAALL